MTWIGKYVFYGCQNIKIAVSDEKYFVVGSYEGTGKDIIAARKILQTGKLDSEVKIPLDLKIQLAVKLVDCRCQSVCEKNAHQRRKITDRQRQSGADSGTSGKDGFNHQEKRGQVYPVCHRHQAAGDLSDLDSP